MPATVQPICSAEALAALRHEWEEMAAPGPAYPFTSHLWQETWWEAFGRLPRRLLMLALRSGEALVGVLPLMLTRGSLRGLPLRLLSFAQDAAAPRADILWRGQDSTGLGTMLDHLGREVAGWDCLVLRKIPADSSSLPALQAALADRGYRYHVHPSIRSPYIPINGDWEAFFQSRSVKFRKSCRNKINRVQRSHQLEVEEITDWGRFAAVYEEIRRVCSRSWKAGRGAALTNRPERVWFYQELARQAAEQGWLSVWTLRFDGKMVAYEYHLRVSGISHGLLASFDQEFEDLSPGSVLDYHVVKQLFLDKGTGYDQGGDSAFYKRRWTDLTLDHVDIVAFPRHLRAGLANLLEYRMITWLRNGRARLIPRSSGPDHRQRYLAVRESTPWGAGERLDYEQDSHD